MKEIATISSHTNCINFILILHDGRIASCSWDKTIKIHNLVDYKCEITLIGHETTIYNICQLPNNNIVSCSLDKIIKIWSISHNSYKCEHTIENAHEDWIYKVITLTNDRIASCSNDKTIKVWSSKEPYTLLSTLTGHKKYVIDIIQLKDKEKLVSGSRDYSVKVWNLTTYQCEATINKVDCCFWNDLVQIDDNRIAVGGNNIVSFVDIVNFKLIKQILDSDLNGYIRSLCVIDNKLLCGCGKDEYVDMISKAKKKKFSILHIKM